MMKKSMDVVSYEYKDSQNILTVTKTLKVRERYGQQCFQAK